MTAQPRAVFVTGVIYRKDRPLKPVREALDSEFGPRLNEAEPYPFDFTDYYEDELGTPLKRSWGLYRPLFNPANITRRKQYTMSVEDRFRDDSGQRLYNIDTGYITGSSFVLASRKNHSHRIYMGGGVYTEITLRYEHGEWQTMPHTYPEFDREGPLPWLDDGREYWVQQIT